MKKKLIFLAIMVIALMALMAISVSAENNIIKLDTLPTLEEIHANPSAYVSRIDALEETEYKAKDPDSVVVLSDLAETPTYYVYPCYYLIRGTAYNVDGNIDNFNSAILAVDSTAFASYTSEGKSNGYMHGECDYVIRLEMPKYITSITGNNKFQGCKNIKEVYFPTHVVEDTETGKLKEVVYITSVTGQNLFGECENLEVIHNIEKLPAAIVNGNNGGFSGCKALKEFKFPEGVTSIPQGCFQNCYALENIEIPYGVTSIGQDSFNGCRSITEMILPNTVTAIAKRCFSNMPSLKVVNFGAGLTKLSSGDHNCEVISGWDSKTQTMNVKFIYIPTGFATTVSNTGNSILDAGTNVTMFYTGDLDQAEALRTKLTTSASNSLIKNAVFIDYMAPENAEIDYSTYAQTIGKTILVYNYNDCEAFYNNIHNYEGTGNCLDGVTCTQCGDNIASFEGHNMVETLVYDSFLLEGKYNKFCSNASDCAVDRIKDEVAPAIFVAGSGFSTKGEDGIASGYVINIDALEKYNELNDDITFGVMVINPDYLDGKESFLVNGEVNAEKGFIKTDMSDVRYSNVSISVTGFVGNAENMSIVIALYAYTDAGEVEFLQSQTTKCAHANVTLGTERLYTVNLNSVKSANSDLSSLGEYVMPSKKEQE